MILINKILLLGLLCAVSFNMGHAQSAMWLIKPQYRDIRPLGESLYKLSNYSKMSVVNVKENKIIAIADSITFMTNGYALCLNVVEGKYKISAIINSEGVVKSVSGDFYAGEYAFFSEDLCAVYNKKDKYGFIDTEGKLVIPCKYSSVHPFREGYASVCTPKRNLWKKITGDALNLFNSITDKKGNNIEIPEGTYTYIDRRGVALNVSKDIGAPLIATTFCNGTAFVKNAEGNGYLIDLNGKIIVINPEVTLRMDDYFSLSDDETKVNQPYVPRKDHIYTVFIGDDGKYGYKSYDNILLPPQFDSADDFYDGLAVVNKEGDCGIIKKIDGMIKVDLTEEHGKLGFSAIVPSDFNNVPMILVRSQEGGGTLNFVLEGMQSKRSLNTEIIDGNGEVDYILEADDLQIWQYDKEDKAKKELEKAKQSKQQKLLSVSAQRQIKANANNICIVRVRVTNNSSLTQNISVNLSTGNKKTIRLGAGKSGVVTFSVKTIKKTKCTISARCNGSSSYCTTTLEPAFIL